MNNTHLGVAITGNLQRLQNMDSMDRTVQLFTGIYGVGKKKAVHLAMQGFRTLQQVLEKGNLNKAQRIGIELYYVHCLGASF